MVPESSTGLYWSIRGHVACASHAAEIEPSRWAEESWNPLPPSSQGVHGVRYRCEFCSPVGSAMVRGSGPTSSVTSER